MHCIQAFCWEAKKWQTPRRSPEQGCRMRLVSEHQDWKHAAEVGEAHWNRPPWPGSVVTICMSCFMTGDPGKEHGTNKPPPTGRVRERSERKHRVSVHFPESLSLAPILAERCVHHQEGLWIRRTGQRPPGNESHHHKTQDCEPVAEQSPAFPYPPALYPGALPNKISGFVSTCVSSDNSFPSVRQEPSFGPWKGSPFLQQKHFYIRHVPPALLPVTQNSQSHGIVFPEDKTKDLGRGEVIKKWQQMSLAASLSMRPLHFLEKQEKQPCIQKKPKQHDLI